MDAEHREPKEGLAKALATARGLTKVSGNERFGFADIRVIKARFAMEWLQHVPHQLSCMISIVGYACGKVAETNGPCLQEVT